MSEFLLYFDLGFDHIIDLKGYDHLLFVIALCVVYISEDWKKLLILITAFTVGHSITLALSTFRVINFSTELIEFLIPATIFFTAVRNLFKKEHYGQINSIRWNYLIALFFGLIHGLGFSNYLRSLLGKQADIVLQLLAFNLGLEIGQLLVVLIVVAVSFIMINIFGVSKKDWRLIISSAIAGITLVLLLESKFW